MSNTQYGFTEVPIYNGNCKEIFAIRHELEPVKRHLFGAYVHGSHGVGDPIEYSDLDVLAIINETALTDEGALGQVMWCLYRARKYMYRIDPLQHHGWFILTSDDFMDYPEHEFPMVLFGRSASLFDDLGTKVPISGINRTMMRQSFDNLANQVLRTLASGNSARNLYTMKSLLSEFMLLPALFLQAKTWEGVFKGDSFRIARRHFNEEEWAVMDEISKIRSSWEQPIGWLRRSVLHCVHPMLHPLRRRAAPPIPLELRNKIHPDLFFRMRRLISRMMEQINDAAIH